MATKENKLRLQAEALLDNPNVQMFQELLSRAEGTTTHGYNTAFGGGKIEDLTDHPRKLHSFKQTDGKKNKTSAAGKYQMIQGTWDGLSKRLGLTDFSPRSQDLALIDLLREHKALDTVVAGDFEKAADIMGNQFASLPSSKAPQNKRGTAWLEKNLADIRQTMGVEDGTQGATQYAAVDPAYAQGVAKIAAEGASGDQRALDVLASIQSAKSLNQVDEVVNPFLALTQTPPEADQFDSTQAMATLSEDMQTNDPIANALANLNPPVETPVDAVDSLQSLASAPLDRSEGLPTELVSLALMDENDQSRQEAINQMFRPDANTSPVMHLPTRIEDMINDFLRKSV